MMTSDRPLEDLGKLLVDAPGASAILDLFLHHAELMQMSGRSYRLRHHSASTLEEAQDSKPAIVERVDVRKVHFVGSVKGGGTRPGIPSHLGPI